MPQPEIARRLKISLRSVERVVAYLRAQSDPVDRERHVTAKPPTRCPECGLPSLLGDVPCRGCREEQDRADRKAVREACDTLPPDELARIARLSMSPARRVALLAAERAKQTTPRRRGRRSRYDPQLVNSFHP
jgi:hypothetical protein